MRFAFVGCLALLFACRSDPPIQSPPAQVQAQLDSPTDIRNDTAGSGVQADSLLDAMREGSPKIVATPRGDTLEVKGGEGFGNDTLHPYALEAYYWNGTGFLRIKRIVAFKADGSPQWSTSLRTAIPVDSGQAVVAKCQVATKDDPFVFATILDTSYPSQLRHAWRFDTTRVALREIVTTDVKCSHMLGYED